MKLNSISIPLFICILFSSCKFFSSNDISEEEQMITKQIHDSLSRNGKHGYFTVTFIVGRIKTMPLANNLPAGINVIKIDQELLDKPIKFKFTDSSSYQIAYPKNKTEDIVLNGVFGEKAENEQIQLEVSRIVSTDAVEVIKTIDYLFKIHSY